MNNFNVSAEITEHFVLGFGYFCTMFFFTENNWSYLMVEMVMEVAEAM